MQHYLNLQVTVKFVEESEHKMKHSVFADTGHADYLTTGSTLGEMALLTGQKYNTHATCETAVQVTIAHIYFVSETTLVFMSCYPTNVEANHEWPKFSQEVAQSIGIV